MPTSYIHSTYNDIHADEARARFRARAKTGRHKGIRGDRTGVLKFSLAGANNSVPMPCLTPCIVIVHVYTL